MVILIIAIISSFAIPKFSNIDDKTSYIKLKSEYALILNGMNEYKTKKILLGEDISSLVLDEANINQKDERLFVNILDFEVLSTNLETQEKTKWIKKSQDSYSFVLTENSFVDFKLEENNFNCISEIEICKGLE